MKNCLAVLGEKRGKERKSRRKEGERGIKVEKRKGKERRGRRKRQDIIRKYFRKFRKRGGYFDSNQKIVQEFMGKLIKTINHGLGSIKETKILNKENYILFKILNINVLIKQVNKLN